MRVLLLVDILNDFAHPKGSMYTPGGETISKVINTFSDEFDHVVLVKDWHPANHKCFASNNEGKKVFDVVTYTEHGSFDDLNKSYGYEQILWHDHCVQDTWGSEAFSGLNKNWNYVQLKGMNPDLDSYSAFLENDLKTKTGLTNHLREIGATEVYVVGLATDYCIKYTVLDAIDEGFKTFVVVDAIRGINLEPKDSKKAMQEMLEAGATLIDSKYLREKLIKLW